MYWRPVGAAVARSHCDEASGLAAEHLHILDVVVNDVCFVSMEVVALRGNTASGISEVLCRFADTLSCI